MHSAEKIESFIQTTLLTETAAFAPRGFESKATIYRSRLKGSFVSTLINGPQEEIGFWAPAGRHRYSELLKWLGKLTGEEAAYWFYVREKAGGRSDLSWVRTVRNERGSDFINAPLDQFETEPAPAGGGAHLGMLGQSCTWLLLHTHYAEEEFEISIHGQIKLCNDLCRLLRVTG